MTGFYLTIDDGPSSDMAEKLAFLNSKNTTALWFLLGKNLERNMSVAVDAIRSGHILGNHSFSHPRFSLRSVDTAREEISKTEILLDQAYAMAGVERPIKVFRFPYGDQGLFFHKRKLQNLLKEFGFQSGPFRTTQYKLLFRNDPKDTDWLWSYDVHEWAIPKTGILGTSIERVETNLEKYLDHYSPNKNQIILIHDHEKTHQYFSELIQKFLDKGIEFNQISELFYLHGPVV